MLSRALQDARSWVKRKSCNDSKILQRLSNFFGEYKLRNSRGVWSSLFDYFWPSLERNWIPICFRWRFVWLQLVRIPRLHSFGSKAFGGTHASKYILHRLHIYVERKDWTIFSSDQSERLSSVFLLPLPLLDLMLLIFPIKCTLSRIQLFSFHIFSNDKQEKESLSEKRVLNEKRKRMNSWIRAFHFRLDTNKSV